MNRLLRSLYKDILALLIVEPLDGINDGHCPCIVESHLCHMVIEYREDAVYDYCIICTEGSFLCKGLIEERIDVCPLLLCLIVRACGDGADGVVSFYGECAVAESYHRHLVTPFRTRLLHKLLHCLRNFSGSRIVIKYLLDLKRISLFEEGVRESCGLALVLYISKADTATLKDVSL